MFAQLASAGIGAIGSLISGSAARRAAKRTERLTQFQTDLARDWNAKEMKSALRHNTKLGKQLLNTKETTVEATTGGRSSSTSSSFDADAMMKAAEASGINPITFLRNGGMAAFVKTDTREDNDLTVTTTRKGHNAVPAYQMMMKTPDLWSAAPVTHVPGAGEAVGGAMSQLGNALGDIFSRQSAQDFAREQAQNHQGFQRELMMMSLAGAQKGGAIPGGRSFFTPGFSTAGSSVTRQTQGGLSGIGTPTAPTAGDRTNTNPYPVGSGITTNPRFVDAEQAESRYGDIAQEFFGLGTLGADVWHNVRNYLSSSPTAARMAGWIKDLGIGVKYDPTPKPLTFTVKTPTTKPKYTTGGSF